MLQKIMDKFRVSVPENKIVNGVVIKKLPLGAYLNAIESLKNLPDILMKNAFPGLSAADVLEKFKGLNEDMLVELAGNLISTVPEQALRFVSGLIDVAYEPLRDDPNIGLNGLKNILMEFWKVNDLSNFYQDAVKAVKKSNLLKQTQSGFRN